MEGLKSHVIYVPMVAIFLDLSSPFHHSHVLCRFLRQFHEITCHLCSNGSYIPWLEFTFSSLSCVVQISQTISPTKFNSTLHIYVRKRSLSSHGYIICSPSSSSTSTTQLASFEEYDIFSSIICTCHVQCITLYRNVRPRELTLPLCVKQY